MATTKGGDKPPIRNDSAGATKPGQKGADALILALATGQSVPQAAKAAGIGVATAYRRLNDPDVRREVSRVRDRLLGEAVGRLLDTAARAIDTLKDNLDDEDGTTRNRAALGILSHMLRGVETAELARRVAELEAAGGDK